jgi:hypothetical protein
VAAVSEHMFGGEKKQEEKVQNVYLKFDLDNQELVNEVADVISCYQGKCPVMVQHNKKLYNLGVKANPINSFIAEISEIIGMENIKII